MAYIHFKGDTTVKKNILQSEIAALIHKTCKLYKNYREKYKSQVSPFGTSVQNILKNSSWIWSYRSSLYTDPASTNQSKNRPKPVKMQRNRSNSQKPAYFSFKIYTCFLCNFFQWKLRESLPISANIFNTLDIINLPFRWTRSLTESTVITVTK